MAITYPRDIPAEADLIRCEFSYEPAGDGSRSFNGGFVFTEKAGGQLWRATYATRVLSQRDYGTWNAWFKSLRGGTGTFKGYDASRPAPIEYLSDASGELVVSLPATRFNGSAFDGTLNITAAGGGTIAIGNAPNGFQLRPGDYISFPWRGNQALVMALENAQANSSGVIAAFAVAPWLFAGGSVPVVGTILRPWCAMRPVPDSWSAERTVFDPIQFEAIQVA